MSILDIEQKIDTHWLELLGFRRVSGILDMWKKEFYVNFKFDYPYEYEPIRRRLSFTLVYDITKTGNALSYRLSNPALWDRYEHHMSIMYNITDKDVIAFVKGFPEYIKQKVTIIDPHLFYERDERPGYY